MSRRGRLILAVVIGVGLTIRIAFALKTVGVQYDLDSYLIAADLLRGARSRFYEAVINRSIQGGEDALRWPYPPALLSWFLVVAPLRRIVDLPVYALLKLPMIFADLMIALALAFHRRALTSETTRLKAAALVALGPTFFLISSYHGQIDSVAILAAVLAVMAWSSVRPEHRAVISGVLVGIGIAIKTVPVAVLGALIPQCRNRLETAKTVVTAAVVPAILLAPFVISTPLATARALRYIGAPGVGGLSLVLQPNLAHGWMLDRDIRVMPWTIFLWKWAGAIVVLVVAGLTLLFLTRRVDPIDAAVLIWLAIYVFAPTFFFQYLVWGTPFFLLAGHLRWTAAMQAVAAVPTLITILRPWEQSWVMFAYTPLMIALWVGFLVAFVILVRRVWHAQPIPLRGQALFRPA